MYCIIIIYYLILFLAYIHLLLKKLEINDKGWVRECSQLERLQHFGVDRGHGHYVVPNAFFPDEKINIARGQEMSHSWFVAGLKIGSSSSIIFSCLLFIKQCLGRISLVILFWVLSFQVNLLWLSRKQMGRCKLWY